MVVKNCYFSFSIEQELHAFVVLVKICHKKVVLDKSQLFITFTCHSRDTSIPENFLPPQVLVFQDFENFLIGCIMNFASD